MSAVATSCVCQSIGRTDLRQCPEHFYIFRGDRRLTSVSRIIRASFPMDPGIPPEVLENARVRGEAVDRLFAAYVLGQLDRIPAGTRTDARDLFLKLQAWYDRQNFRTVSVQVLLGSEDIGGVLDFRFDDIPVDLKCTSKIEETHRLQVAIYADMDRQNRGMILHITERMKEPRLESLTPIDFDDSRVLVAHWRMTQRRRGQS